MLLPTQSHERSITWFSCDFVVKCDDSAMKKLDQMNMHVRAASRDFVSLHSRMAVQVGIWDDYLLLPTWPSSAYKRLSLLYF